MWTGRKYPQRLLRITKPPQAGRTKHFPFLAKNGVRTLGARAVRFVSQVELGKEDV